MTAAEILAAAQARGKQMGLPYAGALLPAEAHQLMQQANAKLVDVRTQAEWDWVGRVPDAIEIELSTYPGGERNPHFIAELSREAPKDAVVMFLCRSGARSHNAAHLATQAGYAQCYNVLQGFEGDRDADGHRKTVGGWCAAGLPWLGA
jgi:rhodanese-related sulfurtransferase